MLKKFIFVLSLTFAMLLSAANPKYIFLFIGDGMSLPQRMLAEEFLTRTQNKKLLINHLDKISITTTRCANSFITDSAASGTAIACGEKTNSHFVGVTPDGKKLESSAELAKKCGKKVGIITSVTLNHATPSAFYAHNADRANSYQIGLDFVNSNFDYFGGGGFSKHNDKKDPQYQGDLYDLATKKGYTIARKRDEILTLRPGCGKVVALGTDDRELPYTIDRTAEDLNLCDFVEKGIELLDNPNGFFMMIEGGKIDWVCHNNDAGAVLHEVIDFDRAVQVAYDFAQKHQDEVLIVVTGDHETGGLTLGFAGTGYKSFIERLAMQKVSRAKFEEKIKELGKNVTFDDVKPLITQYFGLKFPEGKAEKLSLDLTPAEIETLRNAFEVSYGAKSKKNKKRKKNTFAAAVSTCFNNKCGLAWTTGAHTALPVSTTVYGNGSTEFGPMIDNTDISKIIKKLLK